MSRKQEPISPQLYDFIKQKVNLAEYLATEAGCSLKWYETNISAGTICPLPTHKDSKPSFRIKYLEDARMWIFHCLGCGVHGTIINFVMEYHGLNSSAEAVLFLCDKFGFKKDQSVVTDGLKDVKKKINLQRKIDCAHVVASSQCFSLLKKDYNKYNKWVLDCYKQMNKALGDKDIDVIESIGFEASNKMMEK